MSAIKPQYLCNLIIQESTNTEYKRIGETMFVVLRNFMRDFSEEQCWDYIDQYKSDVIQELYKKTSDNAFDGIEINFELLPDGSDYYIRFFDKPEMKLLREIQKGEPKKFEFFCKSVLEKLGGLAMVTGSPHDGGIDFSASDLRLNNLPGTSTKGSRIFLLGQAKRYKDGHHVTEKELREFVGASVKRIDEWKKERSDQFGIFQPVILAFWTTSDFHSNAKQLAKELGLWYLNGVALTQLALKIDAVYDDNLL